MKTATVVTYRHNTKRMMWINDMRLPVDENGESSLRPRHAAALGLPAQKSGYFLLVNGREVYANKGGRRMHFRTLPLPGFAQDWRKEIVTKNTIVV